MRHKFVTDAFAILCNHLTAIAGGVVPIAASAEEGTVGTQTCGHAFEIGVGDLELEHFAKHQQGMGTIGRTAPQTGTERNLLFEKHIHGRQVGKPILQEPVGFHAEVLFGVAIDGDARLMPMYAIVEGADAVRCKSFGLRQYLKAIAPIDGIEKRLENVVAIFATTCHEKAYVDLGMWKK